MRPGFWPYLILRLRRVGKLFLPLLLVAALLMGGIGWFGVSLVRQDEAGAQRVEIGVVGDFEDSVLRMGMFALRNLDSSRFSIEFVQFSEESAYETNNHTCFCICFNPDIFFSVMRLR